MVRLTTSILACFIIISAAAAEPSQKPPLRCGGRWGGVGGAYLMAPAGELWIDIERIDLNTTKKPTILRAILLGPDRRVIDEQLIPDDGRPKGSGPGPVQNIRLAANVTHKGVYALNITVSNDRYGEHTAWSLKTNCPRYLIETSRSHRDAPHEEPIVLLSPGTAGEISFLPRPGRFGIDATGLAPGSTIAVVDAHATLPVSADGHVSASLEAPVIDPEKPWRLRLSKCQGVIHIDGVTRWAESDPFPNMSLWTPQPESWFPLAPYRWLLTPYNRLIYGKAGDKGEVPFLLHNNSLKETTVSLDLEFDDDGAAVHAALPQNEYVLPPKSSKEVRLTYQIPQEGDRWIARVRATPTTSPEFTTYSTVEFRKGTPPSADPLDLPIVITPYRHENQLFAYSPDYPLANEFYFDLNNRPLMLSENEFDIWRDSQWLAASIPDKFTRSSTKIAFDKDNWIYVIGQQDGQTALAYSADNGRTFKLALANGRGASDIEQFSGHNPLQTPPPFCMYTETERDPKLFWRRLNDIQLFLPEKTSDGAITIPAPILISRKCIGYSGHSGIPSTIVSRGDNVHVIWAEATEPEENAPGVPTFAATYNRNSRTLSQPTLIGYGAPPNDIHNTPCITIDSKGYLHALVGTHGRTFKYARSIEPESTAGFSPPEDLGPQLEQTYIGMVCDPDDTLHVAFRLWQYDTTYFPAGNYAVLAYMSKKPGQPWSQPKPLVTPPFSSYSVYRHRLTIDRKGHIFLSYDTWSTFWFYRNDHPGNRRALLTSPDHGATWKLAGSADLHEGQ